MISPAYLEQLKALHASREWGASGYSHAPEVLKWMKATGARTVLDYGCGRGTLKPALVKAGIKAENIFEYDPAIPGKDGSWVDHADLLVANDVLEHIEPDRVESTLFFLRTLADRAAYFTIALTPSKVNLPDGRNAHITLLTVDEWLTHLKVAGFDIVRSQIVKGLWVWAK